MLRGTEAAVISRARRLQSPQRHQRRCGDLRPRSDSLPVDAINPKARRNVHSKQQRQRQLCRSSSEIAILTTVGLDANSAVCCDGVVDAWSASNIDSPFAIDATTSREVSTTSSDRLTAEVDEAVTTTTTTTTTPAPPRVIEISSSSSSSDADYIELTASRFSEHHPTAVDAEIVVENERLRANVTDLRNIVNEEKNWSAELERRLGDALKNEDEERGGGGGGVGIKELKAEGGMHVSDLLLY